MIRLLSGKSSSPSTAAAKTLPTRSTVPGILITVLLSALLLLSACSKPPDDSSAPPPGESPTAQAAAAGSDVDMPKGRLPADVVPQHYELDLLIDPRQPGFSGTARIEIDIARATDGIWLHGQQLEVSQALLQRDDGTAQSLQYEQLTPLGLARLRPSAQDVQLAAGKALLVIDYQAAFNQSLEGLYKVTSGGDDYAFTQFEATSARLAFPGFDEPAFKVPFDISLTVPDGHSAITNTPLLDVEQLDDGMQRHHFARSKPLPTYLLAFAVGPFDVVAWEDLPSNAVRDRSLPLRGIAVRGKGEQLDYALRHTNEIVTALEDYFQIPYPYAKLDIIAVPDFSAGAMENAGAITYREQLLLLDDEATARRKFAYASVHAHELAHHWFGNLVTPVWWDDIWLNEAFATWMAAVTLDRMDAAGGYRRSLLQRALGAMQVDSLSSVRQIRQPIASDHDIASAFDAITYSKGGGVLAMFERYLGAEAFRAGIQDYLQQYAWGNASADDFINTIAARADAGQASITAQAFRSFLTQPGVPLLAVETNCDSQPATLQLRQNRYLPLGSAGDSNQLWTLPTCIRYGLADGSTHSQCQMLESTLDSVALTAMQCPSWIMPNADGAGYYRFNLPDPQWQQLLQAKDQLSSNEKLVLADSFKAALQAGGIALETLLEQLPQFVNDAQPEVAGSLLDSVAELYTEFADSSQQATMRARLLPLYQQRLQQLGLAPLADRNAANLQNKLVDQLVLVLDDKKLGNELARMGLAYTGTAKLDPAPLADSNLDLISTAIAAAARDRADSYLRHLQQQVVASSDAIYRQRLLAAMGQHNDPAQQALLLDMALSEDIRDNEIYYLLGPQFAQAETRAGAWQWLQQNLTAVLERIPVWRKGRVSQLADSFCSTERAAEVETFFAERSENLQGGPRALANTLETIRLCAARKAHFQPQLQALMQSSAAL